MGSLRRVIRLIVPGRQSAPKPPPPQHGDGRRMMPARGPIDEQTVRSARGALGAHVPGRAGGGVRALPGPLPPVRAVRAARSAERPGLRRAARARDLPPRRHRPRRRGRPAALLAHPRDRRLRHLGQPQGGRGGAPVADGGAAVAVLQDPLLPRARGRPARVSRRRALLRPWRPARDGRRALPGADPAAGRRAAGVRGRGRRPEGPVEPVRARRVGGPRRQGRDLAALGGGAGRGRPVAPARAG